MEIRYFLATLAIIGIQVQLDAQRPCAQEQVEMFGNFTKREVEDAFRSVLQARDLTAIKSMLNDYPTLRVQFVGQGICHAADYADNDLINFFLAQGASINSTYAGWAVIHYAVRSGCQECVEYVLSKGADINARTWWCQVTPVFIAIENDRVDILKFLIRCGASLDFKSYWLGYTVVHQAISSDKPYMVKYLLEAAPHLLNERTHNGSTPLMFAAERNKSMFVKLLAGYKPEFTVADKEKLASELAREDHRMNDKKAIVAILATL